MRVRTNTLQHADSYLYAVDESIPIDQFPQFFADAKLNYAENMLCGDDEKLAVISMSEDNLWAPDKLTWRDLRQLVGTYTCALRSAGPGKADVIACKCAREQFSHT